MGIALTMAHPNQMTPVAALDPARLNPVRLDAALSALNIRNSSFRLVVSTLMAPIRHIY
jgi:hypothetical protein